MDRVIRGIGLDKEKENNKVRTWDQEKYGPAFQWPAENSQQTKYIYLSTYRREISTTIQTVSLTSKFILIFLSKR